MMHLGPSRTEVWGKLQQPGIGSSERAHLGIKTDRLPIAVPLAYSCAASAAEGNP